MMTNNRHGSGSETFDKEMTALLSEEELTPSEIVSSVTPWKRSITMLLIGLLLAAFSFGIFGFVDFAAKFLGCTLVLLGFRGLSGTGGALSEGYFVSKLLFLFTALGCLISITPLHESDSGQELTVIITVITQLLFVCCYLMLYVGMAAVLKPGGYEKYARTLLYFAIWHIFMILLALVNYQGYLPFVMIFILIGLFINLGKLYKALELAGYEITAAPVRFSTATVFTFIALVSAAAIVFTYVFFSKYAMDWYKIEKTDYAYMQPEREALISLGFPEEYLADLSNQEIELCFDGNAKNTLLINEIYFTAGHGEPIEVRTKDEADLVLATIVVKNNREGLRSCRVYGFFRWLNDDIRFPATEALRFTSDLFSDENISDAFIITGELFYDVNGETRSAQYKSLGYYNPKKTQLNGLDSMFGQSSMQKKDTLMGCFSLPQRGENRRGYIAFSSANAFDAYYLKREYLHLSYCRKYNVFEYPARTAAEYCGRTHWASNRNYQHFSSFMYLNDYVEPNE